MTEDAQQPIKVQNPTSSLKENKRKNNYLLFAAFAIVALFLLAYFAKNLLSGAMHRDKPEDRNQATTARAANSDPFANLDALRDRYTEPATTDDHFSTPANNDTRSNASAPVDVIKAASAVVLRGSGSSSAQQRNNNNMRFPEDQAHDATGQAQMSAFIASQEGPESTAARQNDYERMNYGTARATVSALNPSLSIAKGTFIRCSLRTRIVTTIGGEVSCTINNDIYSTNGRVLLVEKGSQVLGHFRSGGQMNLGDARVFVIWNEIRTPNNIIIEINSNATGTLGETGIGGWIDTHFWDRFGSAIMISLITDTSGALTSHLADSNSNDDFRETRESASDVVSSILKETVNIPPTLYRNQGDIVGIMFARDLDFSGVYSLRLRGGR